jgi:hypothetical protein
LQEEHRGAIAPLDCDRIGWDQQSTVPAVQAGVRMELTSPGESSGNAEFAQHANGIGPKADPSADRVQAPSSLQDPNLESKITQHSACRQTTYAAPCHERALTHARQASKTNVFLKLGKAQPQPVLLPQLEHV